ncbi:MAG: hypothetical protein GY774_28070 [Planctomycetes bacterium]|nr:hypothetical protein [Planctomycetota bacterium]
MDCPVLPKEAFTRILKNIEEELANESIDLQAEEIDILEDKITSVLTNIGIYVEE